VSDIMTSKVQVSIDGETVEVARSATVLEAALANDVFIPHLCHNPDLVPAGVCRLCFVDVDGRLVTSCNTLVTDGATIRTDTSEVKETVRGAVELLLVNHHRGTVDCEEGDACDLQKIARHVGIDEAKLRRLRQPDHNLAADTSNPFFEFDPNICVLCGICVRTCDEIVGVADPSQVEERADVEGKTLDDYLLLLPGAAVGGVQLEVLGQRPLRWTGEDAGRHAGRAVAASRRRALLAGVPFTAVGDPGLADFGNAANLERRRTGVEHRHRLIGRAVALASAAITTGGIAHAAIALVRTQYQAGGQEPGYRDQPDHDHPLLHGSHAPTGSGGYP
jgi:bidirectional [NiFe] hydrogenase diaphorase subunit